MMALCADTACALGGTITEENRLEDLIIGESFNESMSYEDKTEGFTFSENRFSFGIGISL